MDATERLLADLISIPSVNPVCDPDGTGEGEIARHLADRLRAAGIDVELRDVTPGRPNLLALVRPRRARGRVILAPHLDTVTTRGMTIDPFAPVVVDGRMQGRGAADTKGSVAAFVRAMERLASSPQWLSGEGPEVMLAGLMGEESGNDGAQALVESGTAGDFAIAGEPTGLRVVVRHRGVLWLRARMRGTAAHGSIPEAGRSAIWPMLEFLAAARQGLFTVPSPGDESDPADPADPADPGDRSTVNLGVVRGGRQVNMVADDCRADLDLRTTPGLDHDDLLEKARVMMGEAAARAGARDAGTVEVIRSRPPLATDPGNPWVVALLDASAADGAATPVSAPWYCDGALFAAAGIPAVAFGPGEPDQPHTDAESIAVADVERAAGIVERFVLRGSVGSMRDASSEGEESR